MSIQQSKSKLTSLDSVANHALMLTSKHRATAISNGFSEEAAEALAVSYHSTLMAMILNEISYEPLVEPSAE